MKQLSKLFERLGKNTVSQPTNLLYQRLEDALQEGNKIWLETNNDSFAGTPVHLDEEFVELLALSVATNGELKDESYQRTTWLIRLDCIAAVAYPTEHWSKTRLESLLTEKEKSPEQD
ncbi:hypothetical protein IQ249_04460 [Lusitaniella coriacea LEGE 07157]|uniref:Uncharacterized protein n=1 Tax=Lusitaniella coriacea LEGE 07157 TaxID=945747 RepID=A0A8J7DU60_9CYAN|nr:hypothetical protein [Lusitaniella coriacea]MBE9115146.1 hypothetical protein [Lusitaniella coriacea LEGE 07157]